jgi:putative oxidoreductase
MRLDAQDAGKLLLRLTVGGLLLLHGIYKVRHGIGGIVEDVEGRGLPAFVGYGVFIGEVVGPLLVLAGWQTRIGALLIVGNMLFAIWLVHTEQVFTLGKGGGWGIESPGIYLLGAACVALLGAGRFSVSRGAGRFD